MTSLDLTSDEQEYVRFALHVARSKLKGWPSLAKALRFDEATVRQVAGGRRVTANLTFRLARLLDLRIDDLLAGNYIEPGMCPQCGCKLPETVMRPRSSKASGVSPSDR